MSYSSLGDLERLTNAETLLLQRRRLNEGQMAAAKRHGVTHSMYGKWERGVVDSPRVKISGLKDHERCLLYRRRSGMRQEDVADDLRCCRYWLNMIERGEAPCDNLLWYWEN